MTAIACVKSNCSKRPWNNSLFCLRHLFKHLSSTFSPEKRHSSGKFLAGSLQGLTRIERLVIILRYWEQFTVCECAVSLDVSESTIYRISKRVISKILTEEFQPGLRVYPLQAPELSVIKVSDVINIELIKYLKKNPKAMYQIKPRQFEKLIAEILASYGWDIQLTPAIKDGGYDIFAISKDVQSGTKTSWIIECKKYAPENKVGINIVRELYGVKSDRKVANALLATSSYYTKGAKDFKASRYDIEMKDYNDILEWIHQYKPNSDGKLYLKDNELILPNED